MDDGAGRSNSFFATLFKGIKKKDNESVTEDEILSILDADENDDIDKNRKKMINNIFEFDDIEVKDVMTHRTDITAIDKNKSLREVVSLFIESGVSRIPVFDESIDNICGVVFAKDLLKLVFNKTPEEHTISEFLREIKYVPETNRCFELFKSFTSQKTQIAVAVDEYGGTAGIVTMEDLLEAIVGNIQDEYDNEDLDITPISPNEYEIVGTADPEEVAEKLQFELPEDNECDTIGGFVINLLGRIPEENERPVVEYGGYKFTVLSIDEKRIEKLNVIKL